MSANTDIDVLLVEDDEAIGRLVTKRLASVSCARVTMHWRRDLAGALDVLRALRIDIVLLDLGLPDARGTHALSEIQRARPHTPVIVVSANGDRRVIVRALRMGAQDYLVKGKLDPLDILNRVQTAIEAQARDLEERQRLSAELRDHVQRLRKFVEDNPEHKNETVYEMNRALMGILSDEGEPVI